MLLITVIYIFCIYFANFIKIHCTVSEINVFRNWHLKCELSNIVRASSLLPKLRSISEYFTLQQDNVLAHRANETVEFCLAILLTRESLTEQCISGVFDCVSVFKQKEATLSTNCNQHCAA